MKFLKLFVIIVAIIILVLIASCLSLNTYTVNTWDGWCSQILGEDLYKKYNTSAIKFDHEAIRADFVQKYNDFIVEKIADKYLDGAKTTDEVVKELTRLKMIGVWNEGDDLYLKKSLLIIDGELGIDEFSEWENKFRTYLNIEQNRQTMDDFQYCIHGTINTHFKNFVLIGPDGKSVTIPLEFTCKESFQ